MKTSYELAMERFGQSTPMVKLTNQQKQRLAELDAEYRAKVADREIFLQGKTAKAQAEGDFEAIEQLEKQLSSDRKSLLAELEEKKEQIRQEK